MGYCNWSSASVLASALTFTYGHDNLNSFSCILPKFVMHATDDQLWDKFNGLKKSNCPIYCDFSHFTSIILPCGRDNSFSFILLKFLMHVTNKQFSDKFNNGWKKWPIYCDFWHFTSIIRHCERNNFKINNGGWLMSSVLLFRNIN